MRMPKKREEHHAQPIPSDVHVAFAGYDRRHGIGPIRMVRNYHLIHYVIGGKGSVSIDGREWRLSKGSGFFFFPGQYHEYGADPRDPWGYIWIAFSGSDADALCTRCGITREKPVFSGAYSNAMASLMESMVVSLGKKMPGYDLLVQGKFFSLFAQIASARRVPPATDTPAKESPYVRAMLSYISSHIADNVSVRAAAEHAGLDEDYASKLFKRETGSTMRDYILSLRIGSAKNMLRSSRMDIAGIARAAGFSDYAVFARLFRQKTGMTPSAFRETKTVW